eukprot:9485848-Heterocapsa_arctica.AAC.1
MDLVTAGSAARQLGVMAFVTTPSALLWDLFLPGPPVVNWEDIVRAGIWNDVIFQTANNIRRDGGSTDPHRALHARLRT